MDAECVLSCIYIPMFVSLFKPIFQYYTVYCVLGGISLIVLFVPLLQYSPFNAKNPYLSSIHVIRELHTGGERSCMHVELDITDSKLRYNSGDHVAIFPVNNPVLVDRIGELLQVDLDTVITLTNMEGKIIVEPECHQHTTMHTTSQQLRH